MPGLTPTTVFPFTGADPHNFISIHWGGPPQLSHHWGGPRTGYQDVKVILLKPLRPYFPPPDHYDLWESTRILPPPDYYKCKSLRVMNNGFNLLLQHSQISYRQEWLMEGDNSSCRLKRDREISLVVHRQREKYRAVKWYHRGQSNVPLYLWVLIISYRSLEIDHWILIIGYWSLVLIIGYGSLDIDHWVLIIGDWSLDIDHWYWSL